MLLAQVQQGMPGAADQLAGRVYADLHAIAEAALGRESPGHTFQPTEIADEAFVRLVGHDRITWQNRTHFFAVAASVVRRLLIDHARKRRRIKRDHGIRVTLDDSLGDGAPENQTLELLALDDALCRLEQVAPRQAKVVELRFYGGLDVAEAAEALGTSAATVKRDWAFARAYLLDALGNDSKPVDD
ncbi:MAG: ECF-type sigma factor [Gemmatimonadales bacterium]